MSNDIATISLRVNTGELERGNQALDKFQNTAAAAAGSADDLNSCFKAGASTQKQNTESLKQQRQELQNLLNKISPVNKALDELDTIQANLAKFQGKSFLPSEQYERYASILDDTRTKLLKIQDAETAEGRARLEQAEAAEKQSAALKNLLGSIDPTVRAFAALDEQYAQLIAHFESGRINTAQFEHFNQQLEQTRAKLLDTGEAAARAQAELAATQAAEKQSAALKNLLGSIDPTIRAFNSLDEQHAQLVAHLEAGRINGAQFEHFNSILNETRQRLSNVADALPEALSKQEAAARRAGISVGQYSAAMRTLPAQFTDIATQLAGGRSPFLILIQQGGQIKDQFGSVGGAISGVSAYLRGLLGLLNPVTIGIGALVVGAGALATAWYRGAQEATEFNKQLILTGNYSAQSAAKLSDLAQKIGGSSGRVAEAARTLSQVVGAGTFKTDQIEAVTRAAMAMQDATGQSVDATIKNFQKLYDNPTKASEELNSTLHFLTSAQYEYIASLERRGDKEGAAEAAAKAYSQAEQNRSQQIIDNMGLIERAASSVSKALKGMWDELLNIGRPEAPNDMLRKMQDELAKREKALLPERAKSRYVYGMQNDDAEYNQRRRAQLAAIDALKSQIAPLQQAAQLQNDIDTSVKQGADADNKRTDALIYQNHVLEQSMTWQEKRSRALSELWKNVAIVPDKWSDQQRQQAVDAINKQFHPDKSPKAPAVKASAGDRSADTYNAETLALQAQLKTLQDHRDINDVISQQRKQQWELISKITILESTVNDPKGRALTLDEKSLLANKEKLLAQANINAGLGDQIAKQQKLNSLADQAAKFAQQQSAKQAELTAAAKGLSTREAEREAARQRLTESYAFNPDAQKKVLAEQEETYRKEDELRSDWQAGAKRGWADYADSAINTFEAMRNVAGSTFSGLSDMLTDLVTTGTASFKSFAASMLKMIAQVVNQLLVAYAVQAAMGWISGGSGGGSTPGGAYTNAAAGVTFNAKGGVYESPGLSKYVNAVYDSPQYFTFQGASKFAKGGVFAEAGEEAIMPLTRDSAGRLGVMAHGSGGVAPVINTTVNVDAGGAATAHTSSSGDVVGRALAEDMQNAALQVVQKHLKPGGMIYNFSKGR